MKRQRKTVFVTVSPPPSFYQLNSYQPPELFVNAWAQKILNLCKLSKPKPPLALSF